MTSSRIPSDLREVTASWLTEALHSKEVSSNASVTGYSAETIAGGNGFMNQVVRLGLRYDDDPVDLPRSVVLKLPSADPALRMLSNRLGSSQRELRFYQDVAPEGYLQTPRCYYGGVDAATGDTVLLLEDVSGRQGDSVAGCSLAEAELAITQLAEFQASWWDSPRLDGLEWMPLKDRETGVYEELYADSWRSFTAKAGNGMPEGLRLLGDRLSIEV